MKRIIVQLDERTLTELDSAAAEGDLSRAALVRALIENALAERKRRREIDRIIGSFTDRPQEEDLVAPRSTVRDVWPD